MVAKSHEATTSSDREFVITRVFDAPRELVWQAWTDPARMAQWWGPRTFTNPVCELDVRPGGAYRIVMCGPDGAEYPFTGVYREVVEPERLVMTGSTGEHPAEWHELLKTHLKGGNAPREFLWMATFAEQGGKTRLTVRLSFESAAIRDAMVKMGMNEGWSQSLDRLAEALALTSGGSRCTWTGPNRSRTSCFGSSRVCCSSRPAA